MATFYMPTKVFDEENAVKNHAGDLKAFGKKALIVSGRHSAMANGSYEDICQALDQAGIGHVLFNEIEENPSVETIMKARDFGIAEQVDFVIGVGGGSPMDASKAIALMIDKKDKGAEYLYDPDGDSKTLPVVAVPTTCGTGSEVTGVAVLTIKEKQTKKSMNHKVFPDLALIDGKYLKTASRQVVNNTAFDALAHMYESYLNTTASDYSRMCVDAGLKMWKKSIDVIRGSKEPDDTDRRNMMCASMMAGMAIAHTATTLPHGLSYSVTTKLQVPHGKAVCYFMAGYLAEAKAEDRDYLLTTAGFESLEDFSGLYREACGPIDSGEEELKAVLEGAVEELAGNPKKLALTPFDTDKEVLTRIAFYESCH